MKKLNLPLVIGSFILIFLLMVILFPEVFTSKSPYTIQQIKFLEVDGALDIKAAPYPPSSDHTFGSDDLGRDIRSIIVYGTKLTILMGVFTALAQFLVAIPFALFGGFGNVGAKSITTQLNVIFSAIPSLLICIILLQLDYFVNLDKNQSIIAFVVVLTIVGWPKLGVLILERVELINKQSFIKGEIAIGKKRSKIAIENVMPHLAPEVIVLFFMEIARNLSLIMQLGVFGIFIGNLKIIKSSDFGTLTFYNVSFEPEWASMLATSRSMVTIAPWTILFPAFAFFVSVLGFNLVGEGLRRLLQKKDSKAIAIMRKFMTFDYYYMLKLINPKNNMKKYVVGIIIIIVLMIGKLLTPSYDFELTDESDQAYENQVVIGSEEAKETSRQIVETMKALNIEPITDEGYQMNYPIGNASFLTEQLFVIKGKSDDIKLTPSIDFTFLTTLTDPITGYVYDATKEDMFTQKDFSDYEDKIVMMDTHYYTSGAISKFIEKIQEQVTIKGVLLITDNPLELNNCIIQDDHSFPIIKISRSVQLIINEHREDSIYINEAHEELLLDGQNIAGIYYGSDERINDEAIMIGMNYNYIDSEGVDVLKFNIELMKQMTQDYENKRSIIFVFIDGTIAEEYNGLFSIVENFPYSSEKLKVYIDLTKIQQSQFNELEFSNKQAPFTRPFSWSIGHFLEDRLDRKSIGIIEPESIYRGAEYFFTDNYSANTMFWDRGIATIHIGTVGEVEGETDYDLNDLGSIIIEVISKNNY